MARRVRKTIPQAEIVNETANNPELRRCVAKALVSTHRGLFDGVRPTHMEGYMGQNFYMEGTHNLEGELGIFGFRRVRQQGQHRVVAYDTFRCPIYLTVHAGYAGDGIVRFNWEKGPVFKNSILENSLNYAPLQPELWDKPRRKHPARVSKLNYGIVHSCTASTLRAWIFLGTKWIDAYTLECPVIAPICNMCFEDVSVADIAQVDDSSDYGVDVQEKASGT